MITEHEWIGIEKNIRVPPAEVYRVITHPGGMCEWLCDSGSVDARPGGMLFLNWIHGYAALGEFLSLEKNRRVRFTWRGKDEPVATTVEISLAEHAGGTLAHLIHQSPAGNPAWPAQRDQFHTLWSQGLDNLQSILETGIDQRMARRPLIGITLNALNDETAARLGAPVSGGILLSGIADGTGAHASGLQADDILIEINGVRLASYQDLFRELEHYQVGDTVDLTYYRGGERRTARVVLTQRQMPSHLISTTELAELISRQFDVIDQELAASIGDTSENQANSRPGSPEWTIKTSLAQIIAVERDLHTWISELLSLSPQSDKSISAPVSNERLTAILDVYPTILNLMEEFIRCQAETIALLSYLPDELVQRKYVYFRIIEVVSDTLDHFRQQIRKIRQSAGQA